MYRYKRRYLIVNFVTLTVVIECRTRNQISIHVGILYIQG